jgi:hypothetical protein
MEILKTVVVHPFFWGLCLGGLFFVLSFIGHWKWKTKREFRRFQKHLSDKLELEAKQYEMVRREKEQLAKENENLRLKIGQLSERPDAKLGREMEIMARAEKRMMIHAPGFAAAWETAKADAVRDLEAEERGESMPRRLFTRLFGSSHNGEFKDVEPQAMLEAGAGRGGEKPGDRPAAGEVNPSAAQAPSGATAGQPAPAA